MGIKRLQGGDVLEFSSGTKITADGSEIPVSQLASISGIATTAEITLAASSTTDGMDVTVTVKDGSGANVASPHLIEVYISDSSDGIGLTANDADADITAIAGAVIASITAEKHWSAVTDASGVFSFTLVDIDNPEGLYVVAKKPLGAGIVVSEASGTNWEGA